MGRLRVAETIVFAALFVFLSISNDSDWDHFFSFLEVERRSWLIDHQPPLWTYQLCAGVARLGDPQSFGLSPLIIPVLIFGSFWGSKLLALATTFWGYRALAQTLDLLAPLPEADAPKLTRALALFYVLGNYFIWRHALGNLTWCMMPILLVVLRDFILGCAGKFGRRQFFPAFFAAFCFLTGAIYHALVFMAVPVLAALAGAVVLHVVLRKLRRLALPQISAHSLAWFLGAVMLALAASSYKWLGVMVYQEIFPRELTPRPEAVNFLQLLFFQFAPTWNFNFFGTFEGWGPWGPWEYSNFSALHYLAVAVLIGLLVKKTWRASNLWGWELLLAFFILACFSMGDAAPLPLHPALNAVIYKGSVRAVGRYQAALPLVPLLFLARAISVSEPARAFFQRFLLPAGLALALLNLTTFAGTANPASTFELLSYPKIHTERMTELSFAKKREVSGSLSVRSYMYEPVLAGKIVVNCYQPLAREITVANELATSPQLEPGADGKLELIDAGGQPISDACRASTYVTQNELHFDRSACPRPLCFNLNARNLYAAPILDWNEARRKWCVVDTPP